MLCQNQKSNECIVNHVHLSQHWRRIPSLKGYRRPLQLKEEVERPWFPVSTLIHLPMSSSMDSALGPIALEVYPCMSEVLCVSCACITLGTCMPNARKQHMMRVLWHNDWVIMTIMQSYDRCWNHNPAWFKSFCPHSSHYPACLPITLHARSEFNTAFCS